MSSSGGLSGSVRAVALVLLTSLLSACVTTTDDPSKVKGLYVVRNAPIPVPRPRSKPNPPAVETVRTYAERGAAPASAGSVRVKKGDTLYGLARRHGLQARDLIRANSLKPPYVLSVGTSLKLPGKGQHVVRKGETLYSISRSYGVDVTSLVRANGLRKPYTISVGKKLTIPTSGGRQSLPTRTASNTSNSAPLSAPPPRQGTVFMWPVKGRIISTYGPKKGGLHNDGINIAVDRGASVAAADAGVVAYAGNGLKGFGNLILVRHAEGWMTAYAHNDRILVKKGDQVRRGQALAKAGSTGGVKRAQVHFEVRKGRRAVDPLKYLERKPS